MPKPPIGFTRSLKPVFEPTRGAPDTNNIDTFHRTKAKFVGWTKSDHMDAAKLLEETPGKYHMRWSSVHWDIGGRWTSGEYDAYHKAGK